MKLFILILLFAVSASVARATDDSVYRFETTYQSAGTYHGSIFGLSSDVAISPSTKLLPRAENLTRTFDGGVSFNETTLSMGVAQKLSRSVYLLGGVGVTPSAQILPKYNAYLDPHFASGAWDFGLRTSFASWIDQDAGTLAPSVYYSITDSLWVTDSVSFVRSDNWYISNASQLVWKPTAPSLIRIVPAFGKTLESAGTPATFTSIAVEGSYEIARRVRAGLGFTSYDSTLRTEKSFLLRLEAW